MERAGTLIGKLNLSEEAQAEARVCGAWKRAAGKIVARHTRAVALVRGKLIVEVEDFVWQRQLSPMAHFLVRNLAQEVGEAVVKDIDFRPMPPRILAQRAQSARPAHPASTDEADSIADPVLRMLYRKSRKRNLA